MKRNAMSFPIVCVVALSMLILAACSNQEAPQQAEVPAEPAAPPAEAPVAQEASAEEAPASEAGAEEPEWKNMKQAAKAAKIDEMAGEALGQLFAEHPKAKELYEGSYGWAAFDNLKLALGISGGGGNGVAVNKKSGQRTYMKMGTGGVGLGLGANKYQIVFLFQDSRTFDNFVEHGWQADAGATASAGTSSAEAKTNFVNGHAIYPLTDKGLLLHADIAGTTYWKTKKLTD